jgi:hypothetical protein
MTGWARTGAVALTAAAAMAPPRPPAPVDLADLLRRAGAALERFSDPAGGLILEERYDQSIYTATSTRVRSLISELLIIPDATEGWVQFRDVLKVDGKPVTDRTDRLARLFSDAAADARAQARRIADEGARYNLNGSVRFTRTLNQPVAPLLFLRAVNQPRSQFHLEGGAGSKGQRVLFSETARPRLIGTSNGEAASGEFWIDPESGDVLKCEFRLASQGKNASALGIISVTYARTRKSDVAVPVGMEEHYYLKDLRGALIETIEGKARYANVRQFKVSVGGQE